MLRKFKIATRLTGIGIAAILGMAALGLLALIYQWDTMITDRQQEVRHLTEVAYGVLVHFQKEAAAGRLTEEEAQRAAIAALRDVRYGNNDYYFIYQYDGITRMLGPAPNIEGHNRIDIKDSTGLAFIREFVAAASKGGDFVGYRYPRAGSAEPVPKLAYVMGFEPWKWVIATALYTDDVDAAFWWHVRSLGGLVALLLLAVGSGVAMTSRGITRPLGEITTAMTRLAAGDRAVEVRHAELANEIGDLARALVTFRTNAAEMERLQAERAEQERRIRRLVEANVIGIVVFTLDGQIREANDAFLAMVGYNREDLLSGRVSYAAMTPPEWQAANRQALEEMKSSGSCRPFEKEYFRKDGQRLPVLVGSALFQGSKDEGVAFVLDLTERKKSEQALRQAKQEAERANAAKSRFLAAASHDLRQPAQSLTLLIETLTVLLNGHEAAKVVAQMAIAGEAMKVLLDGLLDISRLHAGVVQTQMQATELGPMVERLAEEYRPRAANKGVALHLVQTRATIRTDPVLFERILRNLIDNAVKFTENGKILLGCRHRSGRLYFELHDTGIGIPADQVDRVFDEFHQINNPARDRTRGLGLGLTIVRRLAGLLGITVELDSHLGQGTCFTLGLPAEDFEGGRVRAAGKLSSLARLQA